MRHAPNKFFIFFDEGIAEAELDDVACPVVASDPAPLAAVMASPGVQSFCRVTCHAGFEGEQRRPLSRDAAPAGCFSGIGRGGGHGQGGGC